jgi:hypothetical protein
MCQIKMIDLQCAEIIRFRAFDEVPEETVAYYHNISVEQVREIATPDAMAKCRDRVAARKVKYGPDQRRA